MKKRSFLFVATIFGIATLFIAVAIAGTSAPDVIKMESDIYKTHKKGIVDFSHEKHAEDYKIGCGECHHDKDGKPRDLKAGDEVEKCSACHKKPGQIKGKEAKGLSDKEQREYHANALHDNCIGCHKDHNKKNNTKAAPTSCTKCHPKTK